MSTRLTNEDITKRLAALDGWAREGEAIARTYRFANYYETMAFVNATAWVSHREDHHPDIILGYNTCLVRYSTHSAGGLTDRDFACAAKLDALFTL